MTVLYYVSSIFVYKVIGKVRMSAQLIDNSDVSGGVDLRSTIYDFRFLYIFLPPQGKDNYLSVGL